MLQGPDISNHDEALQGVHRKVLPPTNQPGRHWHVWAFSFHNSLNPGAVLVRVHCVYSGSLFTSFTTRSGFVQES